MQTWIFWQKQAVNNNNCYRFVFKSLTCYYQKPVFSDWGQDLYVCTMYTEFENKVKMPERLMSSSTGVERLF